ncbi:MAG: hypothetical protein COA49_05940 [Bacteroidetes bacterium]|nr:MAG: hypothetical protein COA49_05940 [Bacteroidota bacterium]
MNTVIHKADTRGSEDHGWLKVNHTFSFANYHNPKRMHFGVLRVLNDDTIAGGRGFSTHPHDNMEIITIPLEGDLEHKDDMGNGTVIKSGDIQVMSAGKGIYHSEFNAHPDLPVKVLQIWIFPNKKNVTPRYDQISIRDLSTPNELYQILSPNEDDKGVWIHQEAWFNIGEFNHQKSLDYTLHSRSSGVYAFIIEGDVEIEGEKLSRRDGMGIWNADSIKISAEKNSKLLLMEIPMTI